MTVTSETIAHAALVLLGFAIGAKLPDIDLATVFPLRHRSFWTHGPPLALALYLASRLSWWMWWIVVGALPAILVHLILDCFPKHWHGSATIKLHPIHFSFQPATSFVWIALGAFYAGYQWWLLAGPSVLVALDNLRAIISMPLPLGR